jgi:hypothetical protein
MNKRKPLNFCKEWFIKVIDVDLQENWSLIKLSFFYARIVMADFNKWLSYNAQIWIFYRARTWRFTFKLIWKHKI